MGMVTLIDVLKKLNLKLEAETEMRLQLEEKVDRQQQEPVLGLIQGLHWWSLSSSQFRNKNTSNTSKENVLNSNWNSMRQVIFNHPSGFTEFTV